MSTTRRILVICFFAAIVAAGVLSPWEAPAKSTFDNLVQDDVHVSKGLSAYFAGDFETAFQEWKKSAEQGNADAQYYLGILYTEGRGTNVDQRQAGRWFLTAANQGHLLAPVELGALLAGYTQISGVKETAQFWFQAAGSRLKEIRKRSEMGDPFPQTILGFMYGTGSGVREDFAESLKWYRLAAEQRFAQAEYHLGKMYERGKGVGKNISEAITWYQRAATQGLVWAHFKMARLYETGRGLIANVKIAESLYQKANKNLYPLSFPALGSLYTGLGRYAEADVLLKSAFSIGEKQFKPNSLYISYVLMKTSELHVRQGRYSRAEELVKQTIAILGKRVGINHRTVVPSLSLLAEIYQYYGRYADAEPLLKRALAIRQKSLGDDHFLTANSIHKLASIYAAQERYNEAELLFKRSLAIIKKWQGSENIRTARGLSGLAHIYKKQGRYGDARPLYENALAIVEKKQGLRHPNAATSILNLALVLIELKRFSEADTLLQKALDAYETSLGQEHPLITNLHYVRTVNSYRSGHYGKALAFARRATSIALERSFVETPYRDDFTWNEHEKYRWKFLLHTDLVLHPEQSGKRVQLDKEAFKVMQMGRTSAAAGAIARMASRFGSGSDEIADLVRRQQDARSGLRNLEKRLVSILGLSKDRQAKKIDDDLVKQIRATKSEIDEIDNKIRTQFPGYATLTGRNPVTLEETASLLKEDEALVTFVTNGAVNKTHIFVVRNSEHQFYTVNLSDAHMVDLVVKIATSVKRRAFDVIAAYDLYHNLLGPAEEMLEGVRHLIIVPEEPLTYIPFGFLVTAPVEKSTLLSSWYHSVPWLAKKYALTTMPSIASLKALRGLKPKVRPNRPFLAFGDPILTGSGKLSRSVDMASLFRGGLADVSKVRQLPSLPKTNFELKTIAKFLGASDDALYLRERATETFVKKVKLDDSRVIAFSTHALLARDAPKLGGIDESALVMTPPDVGTHEDDGLLTASEIARLKLNADFVLLSACDTAGPSLGGQGFSGLAKAFFYAGARSILVSHWPVESKSVTKLTTAMFKQLKDNPDISRAEAFRRSMISLAADRNTAHPFFWAPFSLVGEGR